MQVWPDTEELFLQEWWWDAVCPAEQRIILHTGEPVSAFWPLARIRRAGIFRVHGMPPLTQHAGPWLKERADFFRLLDDIPADWQLNLNLGFALDEEEAKRVRRQGITVRTGQSQRIEDLSDLDKVYAGIKPAQQRQLRKAGKYLHPTEAVDVEDLIALQQATFSRRGMTSPYPAIIVRRLYEAVCKHRAGRLLALADEREQIMACGLFVHDKRVCYSLTHGFRKTEKNIGAGSLLQWEGIRYAAENNLIFDFEGSNVESIARFNLSFGASTKTYTHLERFSRFFQGVQALRQFSGRWRG